MILNFFRYGSEILFQFVTEHIQMMEFLTEQQFIFVDRFHVKRMLYQILPDRCGERTVSK